MIRESILKTLMRLLEHAEVSTSWKPSTIWRELSITLPSFLSEDSLEDQEDKLCARSTSITMVDSQRSLSDTLSVSSKTWNPTLSQKVLMSSDAKSAMLPHKELLTEEEETTELTVESRHTCPQTATLSSILSRRTRKLKELTNNKLDWQRNKLPDKNLLSVSDLNKNHEIVQKMIDCHWII